MALGDGVKERVEQRVPVPEASRTMVCRLRALLEHGIKGRRQ